MDDGGERPVVLLGGLTIAGIETGVYFLVDSGADMNLLHPDVAKGLGLPEKSKSSGFVSGIKDERVDGFYHEVAFTLGGYSHKEAFLVTPLRLRYGGILGRSFFRHYKVCFDEEKGRVEFRSYPSRK